MRDDWGEQLGKKSQPVICVLDWNNNNISLVETIPEGISPAQVRLFSHFMTNLIFTYVDLEHLLFVFFGFSFYFC